MKKTASVLKFRKTPWYERGTYTYEFATGERVTLQPGCNSVTEIDIRTLHRQDDHEVYINIKGSRPRVEEWQRPAIEQWKHAHPGEKPWENWSVSLDEMLEDEQTDCNPIIGYLKTALYRHESERASAFSVQERMWELVRTLPPQQQAVYQLAMLDDYPNTRVAAMLGISEGMVRKDRRKIEKLFRDDQTLRSYFLKRE